jgi:hypothetical protein
VSESPAAVLLDRATAAKEIGILVALTLIRVDGDPQRALELLAEFADVAPPEGDELDAVAIATRSIQEALLLRGEGFE